MTTKQLADIRATAEYEREGPNPRWPKIALLLLKEIDNLFEYAEHRPGCHAEQGKPCTCGFDAMLYETTQDGA